MNELSNYVTSGFLLLFLMILFHKRVLNSQIWRATITPLASIIGSGFLIAGPLLFMAVGKWSILVMALIIILSFLLGEVIRFNIKYLEPLLNNKKSYGLINSFEGLSKLCLGVAYVISITYYLKLLSSFALFSFVNSQVYENILTTLILLFIAITGKLGGLNKLELYEVYAVNLKLAIIFTLLAMAFIFNINHIYAGTWKIDNGVVINFDSFQYILGFLIIIQGFETSRFLASKYNKSTRIKSMQIAQLLAGVIYIGFIAMTVVLYKHLDNINETSIIGLCAQIAPILGPFLVIAAVFSQFSASIADTLGSGGLVHETMNEKLSLNNIYLLIAGISISLTWLTNIFEIVLYASKGFAIYYALETILALLILKHKKKFNVKVLMFIFVLLVMISVIVLGKPIEG
jgi:hypothetical protein